MDEAELLASLHADHFSDYTVMGVIDILQKHDWRIVRLSAHPVTLTTGTELYEVEDEIDGQQ